MHSRRADGFPGRVQTCCGTLSQDEYKTITITMGVFGGLFIILSLTINMAIIGNWVVLILGLAMSISSCSLCCCCKPNDCCCNQTPVAMPPAYVHRNQQPVLAPQPYAGVASAPQFETGSVELGAKDPAIP